MPYLVGFVYIWYTHKPQLLSGRKLCLQECLDDHNSRELLWLRGCGVKHCLCQCFVWTPAYLWTLRITVREREQKFVFVRVVHSLSDIIAWMEIDHGFIVSDGLGFCTVWNFNCRCPDIRELFLCTRNLLDWISLCILLSNRVWSIVSKTGVVFLRFSDLRFLGMPYYWLMATCNTIEVVVVSWGQRFILVSHVPKSKLIGTVIGCK